MSEAQRSGSSGSPSFRWRLNPQEPEGPREVLKDELEHELKHELTL